MADTADQQFGPGCGMRGPSEQDGRAGRGRDGRAGRGRDNKIGQRQDSKTGRLEVGKAGRGQDKSGQEPGQPEQDYICMDNAGLKLTRRKSVKKPTRSKSFHKIKRTISNRLKVGRNSSKLKKNRQKLRTNTSTEIRKKRSKSFIIKRKSFKKPRKWSSYIAEDPSRRRSAEVGLLPRVRGFWAGSRYVRSLCRWGRLGRGEERPSTGLTGSIPRPRLAARPAPRPPPRSKLSSSDSGVYSEEASGFVGRPSCSPDWESSHEASWRQLILSTLPARYSQAEQEMSRLCHTFSRALVQQGRAANRSRQWEVYRY